MPNVFSHGLDINKTTHKKFKSNQTRSLRGGEFLELDGKQVYYKKQGITYTLESASGVHIVLSCYKKRRLFKEPNDIHYFNVKEEVEPYRVFLHSLYQRQAEPKFVRKCLCLLVNLIRNENKLKLSERIILEASGNIGGSFLRLIQMYQSMGFAVDRTHGRDAEKIYKEYVQQYNTDYAGFEQLDHEYNVLMSQTIDGLLNWCTKAFGFEK